MVWWPFLFFIIPLILMWVYALIGIFRRDMKGWKKVAWVLVILWLPFVGAATYMLWSASNPPGESEEAKLSPADAARLQYGTQYVATVSSEMDVLARLKDSGEIDDVEYRLLRARVEGGPEGNVGAGSYSLAFVPSAGLEILHFAQLRDAGEISPSGFQAEKQRVISTPPPIQEEAA